MFLSAATSSSGVSIWQTNANQPTQFEQRRHLETTLTVASASYDAVNSRTTITWQGSPTLSVIDAPGQANQDTRFLSGALNGQEFEVYSQSNATKQTVVKGNTSTAASGDTARVYIIFHADSFQTAIPASTDPAIENILVQRYKAVGENFQPWFFQRAGAAGAGTISTSGPGGTCSTDHTLRLGDVVILTSGGQSGEVRHVVAVGSSTAFTLNEAFSSDQSGVSWRRGQSVKDVGMQLCIFDHQGSSGEVSQFQHGAVHVVIRQCTHLGTDFVLRNFNTGFGMNGVVVEDSVVESANADSGYPTEGLAIDNNVFETGTVRGTNGIAGNGAGTTVRASDYKPWKNSKAASQLEDARNHLGYDHYGDAIDTSSSNKAIGAVGRVLLVNAPPA